MIFHTSNYTDRVYDKSNDFKLVASHYMRQKQNTRLDVVDKRFVEDPHSGIGNCFLMRVHACASLHLGFWCLKPTDSHGNENTTGKKVVQYFAGVILKPVAAIADVSIDGVLLVVKVAMIPIVLIGKTFQKMLHPKQDIGFCTEIGYVFYNAIVQLANFCISCEYLLYQGVACVTLNWLGPRLDLFFRYSDSFNFGYEIKKEQGDKPLRLLDYGRVQYLKYQFGWTAKDFKILQDTKGFFHWAFPSQPITYSYGNMKLKLKASWIQEDRFANVTVRTPKTRVTTYTIALPAV